MAAAYRGFTFPEDDPDFARLHAWWTAVAQRPSVAATQVCRERLVASYCDYAENKGTSEAAKAVQASLGANAK